jgi:tetratricopeptide (TPR) repeat protein
LINILSLTLVVIVISFFLIIQQNALAENMSKTLLDKGNTLLDSGKYNEAITFYDNVIEHEPNATIALYNKAVSLSYLGNFTDAIRYYDKVLVTEPNSADAIVGKADNFAQLEKYEEAITLYDKALEINPTDAYVSSMKKVTQDALNIERLIANK